MSTQQMTGYAMGRLETPGGPPHPEVLTYLERIQDTLDPYGGRFLIHGGPIDVREGSWSGAIVLIGFPTPRHAREWYDSPAYQRILRLRADHIPGDILLIEGVSADHDSAAMAAKLRTG